MAEALLLPTGNTSFCRKSRFCQSCCQIYNLGYVLCSSVLLLHLAEAAASILHKSQTLCKKEVERHSCVASRFDTARADRSGQDRTFAQADLGESKACVEGVKSECAIAVRRSKVCLCGSTRERTKCMEGQAEFRPLNYPHWIQTD